jgi:uncharacterized protein (TIGR03437 family)
MLRVLLLAVLSGFAILRGQAVVYFTGPLPGAMAGLAADSVGNLYVTGYLQSDPKDICGFGTLQIPIACNHAFVAKLDPSGTQVLYRTMLAGTSEDRGKSIAIDSSGNAYVLGGTNSPNFPVTSGAAQGAYAGPPAAGYPESTGFFGDLFIAKLDPSGNVLYATFLGGPDVDVPGRIRVDAAGNAYVSGFSDSRFPTTPGSYSSSSSTYGGVVAKINPAGTQVIWSTYVSGGGTAEIDVDASANVYAGSGANLTKLSADGKSALYTIIGQSTDSVNDLAVDSQGAAWIVGQTGNGGGFIRKVTPDGSAVISLSPPTFSTSASSAIAVDSVGHAVVASVAFSISPTPNALMPNSCPGVLSGFVTALDPDGTVSYSSYLPASFAPLTSGLASIATGSPGQFYTTIGRFLTKTDLNAPAGPFVECSANSASFLAGQPAPGELISLFGTNLGPAVGVGLQLDANGNVATSLGGTQVLFNGVAAPLLYASSGQINTVVPFGAPPGSTVQVAIETGGQSVPLLPLEVISAAPALFMLPSPVGQAAVRNQDQSINSPQNPAARGSTISLYGTGFGPFNPPLTDGEIAPVPASTLNLPMQVYFGSDETSVIGSITFMGSAPGLIAGVVQINVQIPMNLTAADLTAVPLSVLITSYDYGTQPGVTVAVK